MTSHRASSGSLGVCLYPHHTLAYNLDTCAQSPRIPLSLGDTVGKSNVLARSEYQQLKYERSLTTWNSNTVIRPVEIARIAEVLILFGCGYQTNRAIQPEELPCFLPAEREVIMSRTTELWPNTRTSTNLVRVAS